ncbi:MAG: nuclear transport factor 2 family protein [Gordonia sp. (in: high G+C Gram-positive bacteria)]|uniref:nuclear transport factor 2 family protein n=1 Tax=Gordonia sp. (in: high G+C Gram-positive bacteria) TaxID=84139 RepID=UPI0039E24004
MANDDQVHVLLAKQAIYDALACYCRAMDRIDLELGRSLFHPDATADYGEMFSGTGYGFIDFIGQVHPAMETHVHHLGSVLVNVEGDRAGSEAYVMARLRHRTAEGDPVDTVSHGRYVDQWERRDDVWRIKHRRYLHALDETRTVDGAGFAPTGTRDRTDPSYAVLRVEDHG